MYVLKLKGKNGEQIQADACGADGGGRRHRWKIVVKMVILNADRHEVSGKTKLVPLGDGSDPVHQLTPKGKLRRPSLKDAFSGPFPVGEGGVDFEGDIAAPPFSR